MDSEGMEPIGLISPERIAFDQRNPRGETPEQIEDDEEFKRLRKSVRSNGVLVPLIVRKNRSTEHPYKLVDGERRLRAALLETRSMVPVHIIPGSEGDGRIVAYDIHMLRKQWDKKCEIASIKEIRDELVRKNKNISDAELFKKLREITNHKPHDLKTLLSLLKYDANTIRKVQDGNLALSHLVQIDQSFLSPLKRAFPILYDEYGDARLRKILVAKVENGKLKGTRYLMDEVLRFFIKPEYENKASKHDLKRVLRRFLDNGDVDISVIVERMTGEKKKARERTRTTKKATKKEKHGASASKGAFEYSSISITERDLSRLEDIRPKLEEIAGSFSPEENEYIKEAVCCLENHCFKAATLMLWAAGISRILNFVKDNMADFNKCAQEMFGVPKSFYKHLSKNFLRNATDVQEIRENSNDRHLLCYLCYKKFISVTEFKKLMSNYDTRNDCGHPTDISLSPNEIVVVFENVYNLLLNNGNLK